MGNHHFVITLLTLEILVANLAFLAESSSLQAFLPKETFLIHDSLLTPLVPPHQPSVVGPQRSLTPSAPQQQTVLIPQNPIIQSNAGSQRLFTSGNPTLQQADFDSQRPFGNGIPPQVQSNRVPHRPLTPVVPPQQQMEIAPQRPIPQSAYIPTHILQKQEGISQIPLSHGTVSQQDNVPSKPLPHHVHSSAPSNSHGIVTPTYQTTGGSQYTRTLQQASNADQGNYRFFTSPRPNVQQHPVLIQQTSHNHQNNNNHRQDRTPQQNTIRRPSRRHHMCGVLPTSGDCRAAFPRYYYNNETDQCDCFLYGGCGEHGLEYSFKNLEECQKTCFPSKTEEGPSCKEIFHEDEVFFQSPHPQHPRPLPTPGQSLPQPHPTPNHIFPIVDTSHIPDRPFIIYLINSAKGNSGNTDYENNERRYK